MYVPNYAFSLLHEDRLGDAAKRHSQWNLLRDVNEQSPTIIQMGLLHQVTQWLRRSNRAQTQPQEAADVRRAHAV
jgi:predicted XRE-type DNA-binding protein